MLLVAWVLWRCATAGGRARCSRCTSCWPGSSASWSSSSAATTRCSPGLTQPQLLSLADDRRRRRPGSRCCAAPAPRRAAHARPPRADAHDHASWPRHRRSYPEASSVEDGALRDRRLRRGRRSRASSARPPTWSPRTTCARARRAFTRALARTTTARRGRLRLQGVPVHGGAARVRRGGPRLRRRLGRRAAPRAARRLRARADLPARQREVARPSCGWRSRPASARSCSTTRDDADRLGRAARRRRAQRVLAARHPGRRGRHARGDPHRPGGLEVRLDRRTRPRVAARRPDSSSPGCTCTSARSCARSTRTGARSPRWPRSATSTSTTSAAASASPTSTATSAVEPRTGSPAWSRPRAAELGAGKSLVLEPGRALVANAGVTLYTRRVGQAGRSRGSDRGRRRRDVRQPAADALRRGLRGRARGAHGRRRRRLHGGRQALRVRRRAGARRRLPDPQPGRRARHAGHRRLRARDGQQLQRRPAAAGDLLLRRRRARRRAARDLRGPAVPETL